MSNYIPEDKSFRSDESGKPDEFGKFVTFKALPFPLPKVWLDELMKATERTEIIAVERRCREAIGFWHTRQFIESGRAL